MRRLMPLLLLVALLGATSGQAFAQAWQVLQWYQPDTLEGQANGQNWSPFKGAQTGTVYWQDGVRRTQAGAQNHAWSVDRIVWMRQNNGTTSIAFHIFDWNGGCPTDWTAEVWSATNLPGSTLQRPLRMCGNNELRVTTDRHSLVANREYFAQVVFRNTAPSTRARVAVDTYWNGQGNYHQHYCVNANNDTATGRGNC
jgi:hypothetical protein